MTARKRSRAANRSQEKGGSPPSDIDDLEENEELTSENLPAGTDSLLYEYLQRHELLDQEYYTTLYKYDRTRGDLKTYCERFTGQIPNEDYVGRTFGGGHYVLILQVVGTDGKARGTSRKFFLHKRYDILAENAKVPADNSFPMVNFGGGNGNNGGDTLKDAIGLIQVMMGTFIPLMKMLQQPGTVQQAPPPDMGELMKSNYKQMSEIMKEMFLDQSQMMNDLSRENMGLPEVTEDERENTGVVGMLNTILPMLDKFLPLITAKGAQGSQTVKTIQNMPQYAKIVKDTGAIKKLVTFISEKHGPEVTKKVLQKFKIRNPYAESVGRPKQKAPVTAKPGK